jgi:hypothetical protein
MGHTGVDMAIKTQLTTTLIACGAAGVLTGLFLLHASPEIWHIVMLSADFVIASSIIYTGMATLYYAIETRRFRKVLEEKPPPRTVDSTNDGVS